MSRSDPPTVDILRAALVMKVRRPLWLEQPEKPRSRYQRENRLTMAWGEVRVVRSVAMTKGDGRPREVDRRRLRRAVLSSRLRGMTRPPPLPLLASLVRWMANPISPSEVVAMSQVREAISFALEPGLYGKRQDRAVSNGIAGAGEVVEGGVHLRLGQGLRLLAESHDASRLMTVFRSGAGL